MVAPLTGVRGGSRCAHPRHTKLGVPVSHQMQTHTQRLPMPGCAPGDISEQATLTGATQGRQEVKPWTWLGRPGDGDKALGNAVRRRQEGSREGRRGPRVSRGENFKKTERPMVSVTTQNRQEKGHLLQPQDCSGDVAQAHP